MPYCTQADIEDRIGAELLQGLCVTEPTTLLFSNKDEIISRTVARAISDACAFMDRFLAVRYAVPILPPIPYSIKEHAICISIYFLHMGADSVTALIRAQHRDDIAWLMTVADGTIELD